MKTSDALVLILVLLYINTSTEWPTHTVCKEDNLEIHYKSCGHSIKELYAKVDLIINGKTVLTYSETLCEPGHSKLIFCGKKKGEHLYYEGPVTLGFKEIPQGDYTISAKLTNEDHVTVACADFTVKNYLDYY
ncbi:lymphocyte antigen 86 isoform X2 [Strix aluco]|uniref:lymphocyte antigen 86 isoform X2 n=1 Tax=Strix aluco TaxID=111821 RepID=UPI003DA6C888